MHNKSHGSTPITVPQRPKSTVLFPRSSGENGNGEILQSGLPTGGSRKEGSVSYGSGASEVRNGESGDSENGASDDGGNNISERRDTGRFCGTLGLV